MILELRESKADIIGLQELTPPLAEAITDQLGAIYPHSYLEPRPDLLGMGILSKFPLKPEAFPAKAFWVFKPQVVTVAAPGSSITFINTHMQSTFLRSKSQMRRSIRGRKREVEDIAEFVMHRARPLIVATDLNATPLSEPYAILTEGLTDTWANAGFGLGHTFPGIRLIRGWLPRWLVRIDYILCSPDWEVRSAHIGPWHGRGDHRPVVAILRNPRR